VKVAETPDDWNWSDKLGTLTNAVVPQHIWFNPMWGTGYGGEWGFYAAADRIVSHRWHCDAIVVVCAGNDLGRLTDPELGARMAEFRDRFGGPNRHVVLLDVMPLFYVGM
jgi:hypothetical protein